MTIIYSADGTMLIFNSDDRKHFIDTKSTFRDYLKECIEKVLCEHLRHCHPKKVKVILKFNAWGKWRNFKQDVPFNCTVKHIAETFVNAMVESWAKRYDVTSSNAEMDDFLFDTLTDGGLYITRQFKRLEPICENATMIVKSEEKVQL